MVPDEQLAAPSTSTVIPEPEECSTEAIQSSCCKGKRFRHKISPIVDSFSDYKLIEVRHQRFLRIVHINSGTGKEPTTQEPADFNLNKGQQFESKKFPDRKDSLFRQSKESGRKRDVKWREHCSENLAFQLSNENGMARNKFYNNSNRAYNSHEDRKSLTGGPTLNSRNPETGCVLFFIHGVGGSADVWKAQIDYFGAAGYEIVVPDLIGHGFSPAPRYASAYHFDEIMKDLLSIFDRYFKTTNVIIGHSYGCSFAAIIARRRARWVSKMVLVSGGSPTPLAPQPGVFTLPVTLLKCCQPVVTRGFRKSAFDNWKSYIPMDRAFDVPAYVLKYTMNGQVWLEGDAEFHSLLNVPTLIIHGKQDKLISLEEDEEMQKVIYGSRLEVLEGASHMVMLEKPVQVNCLIQGHLLQDRTLTASGKSSQDYVEYQRTLSRDAKVCTSLVSLRSIKSIPSGLVIGNVR